MRLDFRFNLRGPFFTYDADMAIEQYAGDVRNDLATRALVGVMAVYASPHPTGIRKRTPFYETRLNIDDGGDPHGSGTSRVNDMGVIYGPWLNGTGSRNWPVTRFRGYGGFSKSYLRVVESIGHVTQVHMAHALRKMN